MTHIFTYGTLMYPQVIYKLTKKQQYLHEPALLHNHIRKQVKNKIYPGIVAAQGTVQGKVYFDITEEDIAILHNFEGEEYKPIEIQLQTKSRGLITAIAYLYGNPDNLQQKQWNSQLFEQTQLQTFAHSHLNSA